MVRKMAKKKGEHFTKKYAITTINLGMQNHPARATAEKYISQHGITTFSAFIRKLIIATSRIDGDKKIMLKMLLFDRDEEIKKIKKAVENKKLIEEKIRELGYDPDLFL